ncbi:antitermination protein [Burkholderia sp. WAC0059]|uniref:ANTAR domain-containing response regulator n=1 Tax=Burkholderia sp. WAC0059 TaxID=2066022 RepID=UPI000C7EAABF|nr:ANTAR domain-containing protein [Burkholderia sp. WAC0059]PLZ03043.1 antitermination protein [Burkholderia sp. WAC0059]
MSRPPVQTPQVLKDLRSLKVMLIHPQDQDGDELHAQLQRIGCQVHMCWPDADVVVDGTGLILMAVRPETMSQRYAWLGKASSPPIIPVVGYENPLTIEAVLQLQAFTTIPSPVRSSGLMMAIALTLSQHKASRLRERYIERLEQKSVKLRVIEQAKQILMRANGVTEDEAYQRLREQAMHNRESIEEVAGTIVKAGELMRF